jgi:hypothetical protein
LARKPTKQIILFQEAVLRAPALAFLLKRTRIPDRISNPLTTGATEKKFGTANCD